MAADAGGGGGADDDKGDDKGKGGGGSAFAFESFTKALSETDRTGLTAHIEESTKGLRTALESERNSRKELDKQIKELAASAEKGSALEKQLNQLQADLKDRDMQVSFLTSAQAAGCADLELALAAVKANPSKFLKRDDTPDWEALKSAHPSLFAVKTKSKGNAGAGTGDEGGGGDLSPTMRASNALRKAAGFGRG